MASSCGISGVFIQDAPKRSFGPRAPKASRCQTTNVSQHANLRSGARSPRESMVQSTPSGSRSKLMACQRRSPLRAHAESSPREAHSASSSSLQIMHAESEPRVAHSSSVKLKSYEVRNAQNKTATAQTLHQVAAALRAVQNVTETTGVEHARVSCRSSRLAMARAAKKVEVAALERSEIFNLSMYGKIDDVRDSFSSCSTSCGATTPSERSSPETSPVSAVVRSRHVSFVL